jgi:FMN phosphatase YigB (HAD superfamily)
MPIDAVLSDWNGTLIQFRDERPILEHVAIDIFRYYAPFHPRKMLHIYRTRRILDDLYREGHYNSEHDFVKAMFNIYNKRIIYGIPIAVIHRSINKYAKMQHVQRALDLRILQSIKLCHHCGKRTGILSAGYKYGIERILTVSGYHQYFDLFQADNLKETNGKAIEFDLSIYKRKHEFLNNLLDNMGIRADKIAYIGDSEDDEGCFEMAGYPILAFYAPNELKQKYAEKFGAFVPESADELSKYFGCV